ncbi:uncharacterized protein FA14DRAFT_87847 [Meira miltonrushii]|uniref:RNA polymerase III RPC4-domain-containing protein n=1 Tax=Meira miltonrushii TaxID=1280837 RepID=A0A316V861_9BASI|nr:uncharacterized protein FA14DRAFT_87847 [Meira miltonrushii]PWN32393.1 hypothetical protein FA14DRAFT_87847 [Meira miltonrushii]
MSSSQERPPPSGSTPTRRIGRPPAIRPQNDNNTTPSIGTRTPSSSVTPIPRSASGSGQTQSLIPSSSSSMSVRPSKSGQKLLFRPKQPLRRPIKEDPDGPASRSASPASKLNGTPSVSLSPSLQTSNTVRPPRRFNGPNGSAARPPRGQATMVASGPFAQGSGAASRRDHSRNGNTVGGTGGPRHGLLANISMDGMQSSSSRLDYREPDRATKKEREDYSDPEDAGIEIIDLEDVDQLDELAPKSLPRMIKKEDRKRDAKSHTPHRIDEKDSSRTSSRETSTIPGKDADSRQADALDLSASEEEEVMDDLLDDFVSRQDGFDDDDDEPNDRLYLFQFPPLFPTFELPHTQGKARSTLEEKETSNVKPRRSVAFADDTVGGGGAAGISPRDSPASKVKDEDHTKREIDLDGIEDEEQEPKEGQIGRLDIYRDGRVQFNFGNGLVMDVTGGSQSSFLQQVMILDPQQQKATTIGEIDRKFVVAPEITSMLDDASLAESEANILADPEGMERVK